MSFEELIIFKLLADPSFSSDRARARELGKLIQVSESTAQTKVSRYCRALIKGSGVYDRRKKRQFDIIPKAGDELSLSRYNGAINGSHWVYCIECRTPNHFYVGMTSNVQRRLNAHLNKQGGSPFTKKHGVKSWFLVTNTRSRAMATEIELMLYLALKKKGIIVGGNEFKEANGRMPDYISKILGCDFYLAP